MNEFCIDLFDSKGHESRTVNSEFGSDNQVVIALLKAIKEARRDGFCRVRLDIALDNEVVQPRLKK